MEEDDLRIQIEQLEDELQVARDRLLEKETEWDQLQEEMETEIQDLKHQVRELESHETELEDEVRSLTYRLDAAEEKAHDEEIRADEHESQVADLQDNVDFLERKLSRLNDDYYNRMEEVQQDMADAVIWWKPPGDVMWYTIYDLLRKGLPRVFQRQLGLNRVKDDASLLEFDKKLTPLVWKFVAPIVRNKYQKLFSQFK